MRSKTIIAAAAVVALLAAAGYVTYQAGMARGMKMTAAPSPAGGAPAPGGELRSGSIDPANGKRILYWHDPMVPGQKFDKPGKSPFMDMQLVPVYEDAGAQSGVAIDPRLQQSLGVRTAEVRKGALTPRVEVVGNVAYDERKTEVVQARANGFVERLLVRAPLDAVRKGQPLAELYVPDWVAAQEEYLSARRMAGTRLESLVDGARQRMRLAGMSEAQIRLVESTGKVQARLTLVAPITGVVAELAVREGTTVMPGAMLFRINGLDTVWINAELPESQSAQVRPGAAVEARTPAFPGAILPEVNPATRTLKARIEVRNPESTLKPGMFATVNFKPAARHEALLVPSEALIWTGKRTVVIVAQGGGRFTPVEVRTGTEAGGETEIREGLQQGQKVVLSGQFLIDSEANLKATTERMTGGPSAEPAAVAQAGAYQATGKVEAVSPEEITLSHEAIPELKWPAMTMAFKARPGAVPADVKPGDRVHFELRPAGDGNYEISAMQKQGQP
jgi:membrane fusion protein, copper/silver efflux system